MALVGLCSRLRNVPIVSGSAVWFLGATGVSIPGYSKLTFSCEKHSVPKKHLTKKLEASCEEMLTKVKDELDYTVDSQTGDLSLKGKCKTVKVGATTCVQGCVWPEGTGTWWGEGEPVWHRMSWIHRRIGRRVCIDDGWVMRSAHVVPQPVRGLSFLCIFKKRQVHPRMQSGWATYTCPKENWSDFCLSGWRVGTAS